MRYFSLFSGIGGFEAGFPDDWQCVGFSEIDKWALAIYRYHFPRHKEFGDATRIQTDELPDFDLLCAGFPCQSFSIAGRRRGFDDTRGTLFFEIVRLCKDKRPGYLLLENVKGLLGVNSGESFQRILGILSDIGYELQWQVVNSKDFGVPQNRERVFIVGHLRGQSRPEVFPFGEGKETFNEQKPTVYCLDVNYGKGAARGGRTMILNKNIDGNIYKYDEHTPPLRTAPTNYNMAVVAQRSHGNFKGNISEIAPTVRQSLQMNATVITLNKGAHQDYRVYGESGIAPTLNSNRGGGSAKHPFVLNKGKYQQDRAYSPDGIMCQLSAGTHGNAGHLLKIRTDTQIRRLTPVECERLQGFQDGWTEKGDDETGNQINISDTQRYKCLGNAVTVNVVRAIAQRLTLGGF